MADEDFGVHDTSSSVADVGSILAKQSGGALVRTSEALHGLVSSLANSLKEFQDVENMLELEAAAGIGNGVDEAEASVGVELLPAVAGILKDMVGALVSDIKANAQVQRLLPAIQKASVAKDHGFLQDLMNISKYQQSSSHEETLVCTSSRDSRAAKRGKGQTIICKHSCEHHQAVVDPCLWRNLPQELVERVFAGLPLLDIFDICDSSEAWFAMSKSSNFGGVFSERYPKLVGLLGWEQSTKQFTVTIYNGGSGWLCKAGGGCLSEHYSAYKDSMYACDGGLVCLVPDDHMASSPILICNPLANILRTLPLIPLDNFEKDIIMVQLVREDDTKWYRVILVSYEKIEDIFSAHLYCSKTRVWSIMDSGLVYGTRSKLETGPGYPSVFDCTTKMLYNLERCDSFPRIPPAFTCSMFRDRLVVLHPSTPSFKPGSTKLRVTDYSWESSVCDLRRSRRFRTNVKFHAGYRPMLFASSGFILIVADNGEPQRDGNENNHHQQTWLLDRSDNQCSIPPPLAYHFTENSIIVPIDDLKRSFMCDLRWDIIP